MTASRPEPESSSKKREMRMGDQECPRCHEAFTVSYWSNGMLVQARPDDLVGSAFQLLGCVAHAAGFRKKGTKNR